MTIADTEAVLRPPTYHVHQFSKADDAVDDLNTWAISLFSPTYSANSPAFMANADGSILYSAGSGLWSKVALQDGWWIVFDAGGSITLRADTDFQNTYSVVTSS